MGACDLKWFRSNSVLRHRHPTALAMVSVLGIASIVHAAGKKDYSASRLGFPDAFVTYIQDGAPFKNPQYVQAMAADGLSVADPKAVYSAMRRALDAEENYKALYLARVFTKLRPDLSIGWLNRANIATSLGFEDEAASASRHFELPYSDVVREALPGRSGKVRPINLKDWIASLMLVADGTMRFGPNLLTAVRDDVSGIRTDTSSGSPSARGRDQSSRSRTESFPSAKGRSDEV